MSEIFCRDCGAEVEKRPEKALSGESELVWTDVQAGGWVCEMTREEHQPDSNRSMAWLAQVNTDEGTTFWGPFTPQERDEFIESTVEDEGVEEASAVTFNIVSRTFRWGDLDTGSARD